MSKKQTGNTAMPPRFEPVDDEFSNRFMSMSPANMVINHGISGFGGMIPRNLDIQDARDKTGKTSLMKMKVNPSQAPTPIGMEILVEEQDLMVETSSGDPNQIVRLRLRLHESKDLQQTKVHIKQLTNVTFNPDVLKQFKFLRAELMVCGQLVSQIWYPEITKSGFTEFINGLSLPVNWVPIEIVWHVDPIGYDQDQSSLGQLTLADLPSATVGVEYTILPRIAGLVYRHLLDSDKDFLMWEDKQRVDMTKSGELGFRFLTHIESTSTLNTDVEISSGFWFESDEKIKSISFDGQTRPAWYCKVPAEGNRATYIWRFSRSFDLLNPNMCCGRSLQKGAGVKVVVEREDVTTQIGSDKAGEYVTDSWPTVYFVSFRWFMIRDGQVKLVKMPSQGSA